MNHLQKRVKALEKEIAKTSGGMFTVHYKDGSTRRIHPGDAILLSLDEADKIERFEEEPGGSNNGILEGLVNALLIPTEEEGKEGDIWEQEV